MKLFSTISRYFLAVLFIAGSVGHILKPEISDGFIPEFLPKQLVHYGIFIIELALGICLLLNKFTKKASLFAVLLLLFFLGLHVVDCFRENPIIGSKIAAYLRVVFQLIFIYMGFVVNKNSDEK
jgi:uncharacterized membrane protein YphA (DoxX/SURF4 family)